MRCPKCNRKTRQYKTKTLAAMVQRHRECINCGYRFMTVEQFSREVSVSERTREREEWHHKHEVKP